MIEEPTSRQLDAIIGLADGLTQEQVAQKMFIEQATVNAYIHRARQRTGARTTVHLVAMCIREKLI